MIARPAKAAWEAAGRPRSGPVFDAAQAESRAAASNASATRAAEEAAAAAAMAAKLAAAKSAQDARQSAEAQRRALAAAVALWERSGEWPRCHDRWPMTQDEVAADAILKAHMAGPWSHLVVDNK